MPVKKRTGDKGPRGRPLTRLGGSRRLSLGEPTSLITSKLIDAG
jgi:hypothetical protein